MQALKSLVICLLLLGTGASLAQTQAIPIPAPPKLGAESFILVDFDSGRVLAEKNPDARRDPASLTKLMTAYIVFSELKAGNLAMADEVRVSERAWRAPGSRMFIEVGDRVRVEDLVRGIIIQSGNDASVALAEHIAGSEGTFAQLMNQYAESLGLANTHYMNATGLPHDNHYTTARDTATLSRAMIENFPGYYAIYAEKKFQWNGIDQYNRNKLLWREPSVDGLKTGHTERAGYCLATSAKREDMRLISTVMGATGENARAEQSQALLNYGFRFFETHRLYAAGETLTDTRVWKGAADVASLGLGRDLYVTVPQRQYDSLEATMSVDQRIMAPVRQGGRYGQVTVKLQNTTLAEVPLVALESVAEGGIVDRVVDEVLLFFE